MGWCRKQIEKLNEDGLHQPERTLLFNILEDHGKKVVLPPFSHVGSIITDGIFTG